MASFLNIFSKKATGQKGEELKNPKEEKTISSSSAPPLASRTKMAQQAPFLAFYQPQGNFLTDRAGIGVIRAGYYRNAIVYRAVRLVVEAAASTSWTLLANGVETRDHPLEVLLKRPNPRESGAEWLEGIYTNLLLFGNAYAQVSQVGDRLSEIHNLRPDRVKVVPDKNGWPQAYDYGLEHANHRFFVEANGRSPILHLRLYDPLDDHYGYAPLHAAQIALDMHEASSRWNKALLDNAARPSGALVYTSSDPLSDEGYDRLKNELEGAFQGVDNAGRPILLEGGLDWKPLSLTPKDMDFMEAKASAAREMALALGVPPLLLGLPGDNTHANYAEANRAFWRSTILPMVTRTQGALTHWLQPYFTEKIELRLDLDAIEALAQEREALWRRVSAATFLSEDEKREAVGYGRPETNPSRVNKTKG